MRAAALLVLAILAAPSARGDDLADARAHFRRGSELYRAGRWREAVVEFEEAHRLRPASAVQFNIAQCREKLGELPAALRAYHDYLREEPDARDRAAVRAAMRRLEERLAASGVQAVIVDSDPPGAEVRIDGKLRGKTPFVIALPSGSYDVALARDGSTEVRREVALALAEHQEIDVGLVPTPTPNQIANPAPPPSPLPALRARGGGEGEGTPTSTPTSTSTSTPTSTPTPTPTPTSTPTSTSRRRVWTWVAGGVAVGAAAAGGYFGVVARDRRNALRQGGTTAQLDLLVRQQKDAARNANVLYGVAGVAGAAGITLFFVEGRF